MKKSLLFTLFCICTHAAVAAEEAVIYWDTPVGKTLRARIPAEADFWRLIPNFAVQSTQSYCSVASAITVLNAMQLSKPTDPIYAPYAYFTQSNFFTPAVSKIISPQTVLEQGMTREQMVATLTQHGVKARSVAGDALNTDALRALLNAALGEDGQFVLANYLRAKLEQVGGGHWSVLAAFDAPSDRVLILDVAKYKYAPEWVSVEALQQALATQDSTSGKARGLVLLRE